MIDDDSISADKTAEWSWSQQQPLLGFEIDAADMVVKLHDGEFQNARLLIQPNEFGPGKYGVAVKILQHLRGLCIHLVNAQCLLVHVAPNR